MTPEHPKLLRAIAGIPRFVDLIDRPLKWPKVKDSDRTIKCQFCDRRFAYHNDKKQHVAAKHGDRK